MEERLDAINEKLDRLISHLQDIVRRGEERDEEEPERRQSIFEVEKEE